MARLFCVAQLPCIPDFLILDLDLAELRPLTEVFCHFKICLLRSSSMVDFLCLPSIYPWRAFLRRRVFHRDESNVQDVKVMRGLCWLLSRGD
jgi:hypothetical protein